VFDRITGGSDLISCEINRRDLLRDFGFQEFQLSEACSLPYCNLPYWVYFKFFLSLKIYENIWLTMYFT
jgi:hypothetical protein